MSDHSNETTHTRTVIPGRFRYGSQAQTVGSGTGPVGGMAPGGDPGGRPRLAFESSGAGAASLPLRCRSRCGERAPSASSKCPAIDCVRPRAAGSNRAATAAAPLARRRCSRGISRSTRDRHARRWDQTLRAAQPTAEPAGPDCRADGGPAHPPFLRRLRQCQTNRIPSSTTNIRSTWLHATRPSPARAVSASCAASNLPSRHTTGPSTIRRPTRRAPTT